MEPLSKVEYLIRFRSGEPVIQEERSVAGNAQAVSSSADPTIERAANAFGRVILKALASSPSGAAVDVFSLVDQIGIDPYSLLPVLEYLEARELVRLDRSDKRGNYAVTITDAGMTTMKQGNVLG